jgi:FkbM family methyltransferase
MTTHDRFGANSATWGWLWLKHRAVATPLETLARNVRWITGEFRRLRHPELAQVYVEPYLIDLVLDKVLTADACCLDVGAHIGSMLAAMMDRAPHGEHAAFEPSRRKCAWLQRRFKSASIHNVALGDSQGSVVFYEDQERPGFSSLAPAAGVACDAYRVPLARLDDFVKPDQRVDFVKLDVEGAELGVLRGAESLFAHQRPTVLFESGPGAAERCGFSRQGVWEFFGCREYDVFLLSHFLFDREPLDYTEFDRCHTYPFRAFNFMAAPRGACLVR